MSCSSAQWASSETTTTDHSLRCPQTANNTVNVYYRDFFLYRLYKAPTIITATANVLIIIDVIASILMYRHRTRGRLTDVLAEVDRKHNFLL